MATFRTLLNIDSNLRYIIGEIEQYFSIKLDKDIIAKIFKDAEDDQVTEKEYLIAQAEKKFLGTQLTILGTVDEYEPETIWIEIQNIKQKDVKYFEEMISG
jgi:hypothetical protein